MSDNPPFQASRRTVIRGGAVGAGALLGALGLGVGTASAGALTAPDPAGAPGTVAAADTEPAAPSDDQVFLKLDGISGDSTYKEFEGWIELADFSWGVRDNLAGRATGAGRTGRPRLTEVTFTKQTDKASPLLFGGAVTGKHIASGQLVVARGGANERADQFIKIDLADVAIDLYKLDTPTGARPMDTGSLTFSKIKFTYYPQDPTGRQDQPISFEWDLRSQKAD